MSAAVRVRRPVAVVVSRFPKLTETFILREIQELERQGQPVELVPLLWHREAVIHDEARPWIERARYTPYLSRKIVAANLRALVARPGRYVALVTRLLVGSLRDPGTLLRTLLLFPKAVYLGEGLADAGIRHLHAHFATHPATVALVASELWGLSFSFSAHAHDLFISRALLGMKLRRARFVRAISRFNRRFLESRYPRGATPIHVIPMGLEPGRLAAHPAPTAGGEPRLICVGALEPYKGHSVLLEACDLLRREGRVFRCELVGGGRLEGRIRRQIDRLGLGETVELAGPLPQEEVARRLASATVVALSSVVARDGQMEGLPVVLIEALAAGRAVVAPDLSGIPELVEDGVTGLLFPPGDARRLAAAIGRLLDDPILARRLAAVGRERVEERFHLSRTTASLLAVLDGENPPPDEAADRLARGGAVLAGVTALGIERWIEGKDSRVVLGLAAGDPPRRMVVKEHRERAGSPPAEVRTRQETACLETVARALEGEPAFSTPRPLAQDADAGLLVMTRADGEPLDALIRRLRGRRDSELADPFWRAGAWLSALQRRVEPPEVRGPWVPQARIRQDLERLRRTRSVAPLLLTDLDRCLSRLADDDRRVAVHGDFWPGNVRITGDGIAVLDLEGMTGGPAWYDPAWFLVHARLFFARSGLARAFRPLAAAFLQGLAGDGAPCPSPARLREARALVAARLLAAMPPGRATPRRWLRRRVLLEEMRRAGR